MTAFEVWEDPDTKARFYFSHSDEVFTTGIMLLPPNCELPKHNRPDAFENLVQVSGKCKMLVFDEHDQPTEHALEVGNNLRMNKGQFHIHANPFDEPSLTLFKADGNITGIVQKIRETFTKVEV